MGQGRVAEGGILLKWVLQGEYGKAVTELK
jgi:hypothetical protein